MTNAMLAMLHTLILSAAALQPAAQRLRVCTNTACRKADSQAVLTMLRTLAAVADESPATGGGSAAELQEAFGAGRVGSCGCLGGCGNGPNCASTGEAGPDRVFYDVFKPKTAVALLKEELGLTVPAPAAKAYLLKRYADRALRSNKPAEALELLTEALNTAGALRVRAACLLARLLDDRADVHEQLRAPEAAAADRAQAEAMRKLSVPAAVAQFESVVPRPGAALSA